MVDIKTRSTCRLCGRDDLIDLYSFGTQYVSDFVNKDDIKKGIECPIDVIMCQRCSLVQLRHTAPQELLYKGTYWYQSGVTQTMRDALRDVCVSVENTVDLGAGDYALDIGSNDGTLLRSYSSPQTLKVGFEPAKNLADVGKQGVNIFVNNFWNAQRYFEHVGKRAKAITACGMFYDLEDPNLFIYDVATALAPDGVFVAQLMCLRQTIDSCDVGNFAHEHLEFYSLKSLEILFNHNGLEIFDVEQNRVNGGSYRLYVRHSCNHSVSDRPGGLDRLKEAREAEVGLDDPERLRRFFQWLEKNRDKTVDFLKEKNTEGKSIHVIGASTKGNVILQWYGLNSKIIDYASERSPSKYGKYTIGSGIPIISEEESRLKKPDYYFVLPYAFLNEIMMREGEFADRGGQFIVPLPFFQVI